MTYEGTCAKCEAAWEFDAKGPFEPCPNCGGDTVRYRGREFRVRTLETESKPLSEAEKKKLRQMMDALRN